METKHFKKGDRVDVISVAGEDFTRYTLGPISADVFTLPAAYMIPLILSTDPGSGTLDTFLDELVKIVHDKPIVFVNVVNKALENHLIERGFPIAEIDEPLSGPELAAAVALAASIAKS